MLDEKEKKTPKKYGCWVNMPEDMHWRLRAVAEALSLPHSTYARMLINRGLDKHEQMLEKETRNGNGNQSQNAG